MGEQFMRHCVDVEAGFLYYSVMVCNPKKAYKSISTNKIRGAVLLPPKQIVVYKDNDLTFICYVAYEEEDVKELLPHDEGFKIIFQNPVIGLSR